MHTGHHDRLTATTGGVRHLIEPDTGIGRITERIQDSSIDTDQRMEAVLGLSEVPLDEAAYALVELASQGSLLSEIRAAAAWGVGQGASRKPELLLDLIVDKDRTVALHAIAAIDELCTDQRDTLFDWITGDDTIRASAAAQLMQRHHCIDLLLDACAVGGDGRLWALMSLGSLPAAAVRTRARSRLTPDIAQVLLPMWLEQEDWLRQEGKEGLDALDVQKIRFR